MALLRRILSLGKRARMEHEIAAELREHMAMSVDDNMARGMSREEAERDARRRFGNPRAMRERVSEEDAAVGLENFWHDLRSGLRVFVKSPGFALVVLLTLALGIGANTAIFELVDAVRLRTLPITRPAELAELRIAGGNHGFGITDGPFSSFTGPMWYEVKEHHDPFSGIFAWRTSPVNVGPPNQSHQVYGLEVSGDFFSGLGVAPVQGRLIEPQDVTTDCQTTSGVVASYSFWKSEMGSQPITSNTSILAEGKPVQVLGVTPPSFFGMIVGDRFGMAYPTCAPPHPPAEQFVYSVMGRLKPGWNLKQASDYFSSLSPGLFEKTAPTGYSSDRLKTYKSFRLAAYPAGAGVSWLRDRYNSSLEILLAITGLVLLIACANLANLMLARASVKSREVAIRMALGATRGRLLRQILLESALARGLRGDSRRWPRAAAQPGSGRLARHQPEHDSSHHRSGLARAPVRRGRRRRDLHHLRHASGPAQHQRTAADVAQIRRTRSGWQSRALLRTARIGDRPDRRLDGASRGCVALCAQLSQFDERESGNSRERDHGRVRRIPIGECKTRKSRGVQKTAGG